MATHKAKTQDAATEPTEAPVVVSTPATTEASETTETTEADTADEVPKAPEIGPAEVKLNHVKSEDTPEVSEKDGVKRTKLPSGLVVEER